ncbi:unnamed protein product [Fraxinus pennsylvanica]|uniref:Uncharacterized protein n=1 Tax=Fraxinus pennsylvanica TaxID=56036 RepID=A0AAD1ZUK6_9LAMI|nr:unnamed protein product [Fraxinus pennsylvanica]
MKVFGVCRKLVLFASAGAEVNNTRKARMKTSTMSRKYETTDYCGYEFDYQTHVIQFLEEPRKNGFNGNFISAPLEEVGKKKLDEEKRNKKSWKSSLFSWLRTDNRNGTTISKLGRCRTGGGITGGLCAPRLTLGHLIGLFNLTKRVKDEVLYMSLGQLNNPQDVQSYGPVYLVMKRKHNSLLSDKNVVPKFVASKGTSACLSYTGYHILDSQAIPAIPNVGSHPRFIRGLGSTSIIRTDDVQ